MFCVEGESSLIEKKKKAIVKRCARGVDAAAKQEFAIHTFNCCLNLKLFFRFLPADPEVYTHFNLKEPILNQIPE